MLRQMIQQSSQASVFFFKLLLRENFKCYVNKEFENEKKILYVLANAPSLNNSLDELMSQHAFDGNKIIGVNFFTNDNRFQAIKPQYHVISDPMFFNMTFFQTEKVNRFYEVMNKEIDWDITLFLPYKFWKEQQYRLRILNPHVYMVPFHSILAPEIEWLMPTIARKGLFSAQYGSVLHHAIYIGMLLGFKTEYIYGADHTFFEGLCVNEKNQVCRKTVHFDDTDTKVQPLFYHYSGEMLPYTMDFFMNEYAKVFHGHSVLRKISELMNVHIVNKTKVSFIDSYDRE